jgi:hypothetical protein
MERERELAKYTPERVFDVVQEWRKEQHGR